jgi:hypothetical protein
MSVKDCEGRKPHPGDMITFTYWSFSEKETKHGLIISIYDKILSPEDEKDTIAVIVLLHNGRLEEYYAFSDDMLIIHTR